MMNIYHEFFLKYFQYYIEDTNFEEGIDSMVIILWDTIKTVNDCVNDDTLGLDIIKMYIASFILSVKYHCEFFPDDITKSICNDINQQHNLYISITSIIRRIHYILKKNDYKIGWDLNEIKSNEDPFKLRRMSV